LKEFQRRIWVAFVDLKAAFDSVDRKALRKILCSLDLHSKVVDLIKALYTDTSCVCADGVLSDWFAVGSGVRQGCRIAPDLFLGVMAHMMERTAHQAMAGITLGNEVLTDLDFADDVALLAEMLEVLVLAMTIMHTGRGGGLCFSDKLVENQNTPGSPIQAQQSRWQMDMLK